MQTSIIYNRGATGHVRWREGRLPESRKEVGAGKGRCSEGKEEKLMKEEEK